MHIRATWFAVAVLSTGCRLDRVSSAAPQLSWRIVDSSWVTPWDEMTDSAAVYRVAVFGPSRTDTLSDILPPWPVVIDDSAVRGLRKVNGKSDREFFRWSTPTKRMVTQPLPSDVLGGYNDVVISPRGQFIAYVAKEDTGGA